MINETIEEKAIRDCKPERIIKQLGPAGIFLPMLSTWRFLNYADSRSLRVRNRFYQLALWDFAKIIAYVGATGEIAKKLGDIAERYL